MRIEFYDIIPNKQRFKVSLSKKRSKCFIFDCDKIVIFYEVIHNGEKLYQYNGRYYKQLELFDMLPENVQKELIFDLDLLY